jgi:hypothetical protein
MFDFDHAGAILGWMYGNVMGQLDTGRLCAEPKQAGSPTGRPSRIPEPELRPGLVRSVSQKPNRSKSKLEILEFQNEMLLATAELLRNETARGILHSINLPKSSEYEQYMNTTTRQGKQ